MRESSDKASEPSRVRGGLRRVKSRSLSDERDGFLVFRNSETQKISVIHTRKDGNYGLIEP